MLIGVCGRKRHGKNTLATHLESLGGFTQIALADPIKRIAMELYGFSYEQVFGDLKEEVDPQWGVTPRHVLQHLGSEVARGIHPETWIRQLVKTVGPARPKGLRVHLEKARGFVPLDDLRLPSTSRWVVTDVRFENEVRALRELGAVIVKVVRPGLEGPVDTHCSEQEVDGIRADLEILNDGTPADLMEKASRLLTRVKLGVFA